MRFVKMHGTGNDFVMVDARGAAERDWGRLAQQVCDRHFGVGSDGLILLAPSEKADLRMRMWNPDGSEAEMCGNGIRCFTKMALEGEMVARGHDFTAETGAGVLTLRPVWRGQQVEAVEVDMGAPIFEPETVPVQLPAGSTAEPDASGLRWIRDFTLHVNGTPLTVACVSMGNPHAIYFTGEDPDGFPLGELGPQVEHHPMFPRRINFHVARIDDRGHIKMRTWERGAGMTLACGTGACATMVAARQLGLTDDTVETRLPGGTLTVQWAGEGPVLMTGPAETVFTGEWLETE